ncbi:hypothetical protein CQA53_06790 [Helicobacter didelphidarum]|uniref:ATPase AAA-type core domain-containing protein n=1 Tax=Helicobacter didelphidarum TaxID=2040648 RepID=A0A3D8IK27_9HELI|nr:DUF4435 domain-containing protein [Helicobacter didelphidarum]RDU65275.1 hypothetical protein CQA53_06790 [Helicobacter didelphidarum]
MKNIKEKIDKAIDFLDTLAELQIFWKSRENKEETIFQYLAPQARKEPNIIKNYLSEIEKINKIDTKYIKEKIFDINKKIFDTNQDNSEYYSSIILHCFNIHDNYLRYFLNDKDSRDINLVFDRFATSLCYSHTYYQEIINSFLAVELVKLVTEYKGNLILIGANGSGKSTFARHFKGSVSQHYPSKFVVIPAQKVFFLKSRDSIPLFDKAENDISHFQSHDKLYKTANEAYSITNDLETITNYLTAEYSKITHNTHSKGIREVSMFEKIFQIWNEIITHIQLSLDENGNNIVVTPQDTSLPLYDFMGLSDGEKCMFYCIASVMIAKEKSYIIVDEPENHLNMAIVNTLWDKLENARRDCHFIYLTHNPYFVSGRNNTKMLWIKSFNPLKIHWDYKELPNENIPQELLVELLGSKKPILFCEGTRDSIDYKLYSILFKNYTIIPAGGHREAIEYCKSINDNEIFNLKAIAIIDKDYYEDNEINKWKEKNIYPLDIVEIENLLCDEKILKEAQKRFCAEENIVEIAKEKLLDEINKNKEQQAIKYAMFGVNKLLNNCIDKKNVKSIDEAEQTFKERIEEIKIKEFYDKYLKLLDEIYKTKDYNKALQKYNSKGVLGIVGNTISQNYKDRILKLISENDELQNIIREKYFKEIPLQS